MLRLINWELDPKGKQQIVDIKEQEIYFGDLPLLTEEGACIFEGQDVVLDDPSAQIGACIDGAFAQIAKTSSKRLSSKDPEELLPHDLVRPQVLTTRLHKLLRTVLDKASSSEGA